MLQSLRIYTQKKGSGSMVYFFYIFYYFFGYDSTTKKSDFLNCSEQQKIFKIHLFSKFCLLFSEL